MRRLGILLAVILGVLLSHQVEAQRLEIPRRHDRPPGPALSPEQAVAKMTVPQGFSVELVAAEPDVVNPVSMCIDEKGRFWITESLEYPRKSPGPGRDRIKVLEDTDGDGRVDKTTIFADGLNIPSGIAVGYGGVWVANAPDLLFMQDTDGDLKVDRIETVVTGFGRTDTHELPNSFTWGPDGWLYGLNGVYNRCHVRYAKQNPNYDSDHPGWKFTCAMWRIHPRTREFQVFAEGTSNPWGIAINDAGDFFISACVIDHLWHIVETGYYIRQGGPYPPHTWPIGSIVQHKHQKAAYCGITWFDSDAYPEEYRNVLYMGNIHGNCINADIVERSGSTYKGKPHPGFVPKPQAWANDEYGVIAKTGDPDSPRLADFLSANDAWFMPVVQKTGPDGCLYVLDWYDQYHCYQDANADPAGVERAKGRLYRVVYDKTGRQLVKDLSSKSDDELIQLLGHPNIFYRETAQRLLAERSSPTSASTLEDIIFRKSTSPKLRMHAIWARAGFSSDEIGWIQKLLRSDESSLRVWGVRLAADRFSDSARLLVNVGEVLTQREDFTQPEIVQLAVALGKANDDRSIDGLLMLSVQGDERVQPVIWRNSQKFILDDPERFVEIIGQGLQEWPMERFKFPVERAIDLLLNTPAVDGEHVAQLVENVLVHDTGDKLQQDCVAVVSEAVRSGILKGARLDVMRNRLSPLLRSANIRQRRGVGQKVTVLLALFGDVDAQADVRELLQDKSRPTGQRLAALQTLIAADDPELPANVGAILSLSQEDLVLARGVIDALSKMKDPNVGTELVSRLEDFPSDIQPKVIEVLTQRPEWSLALLKEVNAKRVNKDALNLNQLRRVSTFSNEEVKKLLTKNYGQIRADQRTDRSNVIKQYRELLKKTPGDPHAGVAVFKKLCGQCHKMYGEGADVGPDITRNGRNNWEQLLQNVFDPSAVIGPGYQARLLATSEGRVLTGLPVEESKDRVVLKVQGGKLETIPRDQIEAYKVAEISMMPEQLEKQLTPQELADLFAYLALDRPPTDPEARILPGAPAQKSRKSTGE